MAFTIPSNQVISFTPADSCPCADDWCWYILQSDTTIFQITLTELTGTNLLGNDMSTTYWTYGTNWAYNAGEDKACATSVTAAQNLTQSNLNIKASTLYKIKFDLSDYAEVSGGDLQITMGSTSINLSSPSVPTFDPVLINDSTITVYIFTQTTGSGIVFDSPGAVFTGCIKNVEVYEMSKPGILIKDCDDDTEYYRETDGTSVSYNSGAVNPIAQIDLNWTNISIIDGCYCICLFDAGNLDNLIVNDDFQSDVAWVIENNAASGWAISAGVAQHTVGGSGNNYIRQAVNIDASTCNFDLEYDVVSLGGGTPTYKINIIDSTGTRTEVDSKTAPLVSATRTLTLTQSDIVSIEFQGFGTSADNFTIDNITLSQTSETCEDCIATSQRVCLETTDNACSLEVVATNDNNLPEFDFENNTYNMRMRLPYAKLRFARYEEERVQDSDSAGSRFTQFVERTKIIELQTGFLSEEQHDALSTMLSLDNVTIDGTAYVKSDGDYTPNWSKSYSLAGVVVDLELKSQKIINRNC